MEFFNTRHDISEFEFTDQLPFSNVYQPIVYGLFYLVFIYGLQYYMQNVASNKDYFKDSVNLKLFCICHNMILISLSLWMSLFGSYYLYHDHIKQNGIEAIYCFKQSPKTMWKGSFGAVSYIFYLSKYYEWIDTIILVLQNKRVLPLHIYHHFIMPILIVLWFQYPWFEGSAFCVIINSAIHTMMYTYYLLALLKIKTKYKFLMTFAQIVQFISGFGVCFRFLYSKLILNINCVGNINNCYLNLFVNTTFLLLFTKFFVDNYMKAKRKKE